MKKFVSIVLTTGLLMGAVGFGALACDRNGNDPDQFERQKRMEQQERYQPPVKLNGHKDKVIVREEVKKPGPAPAPRVRKPAPFPERDHRFMPRPAPDRHDHDHRPTPKLPGCDDDFRR